MRWIGDIKSRVLNRWKRGDNSLHREETQCVQLGSPQLVTHFSG